MTVVAEFNKTKWPSSLGQVISPMFTVEGANLKSLAWISLGTWCLRAKSDREVPVRILRYSKKLEKWEVIEELVLDFEPNIIFKCVEFGTMIAVVPSIYTCYHYRFRQVIFSTNPEFVVAVYLDNALLDDEVEKKVVMQGQFGVYRVPSLVCRLGEKVDCSLECVLPRDGFEFSPSDSSSWIADLSSPSLDPFLVSHGLVNSDDQRCRTLIAFRVSVEEENFLSFMFTYLGFHDGSTN